MWCATRTVYAANNSFSRMLTSAVPFQHRILSSLFIKCRPTQYPYLISRPLKGPVLIAVACQTKSLCRVISFKLLETCRQNAKRSKSEMSRSLLSSQWVGLENTNERSSSLGPSRRVISTQIGASSVDIEMKNRDLEVSCVQF
jgi:hypothetical protein